MNNENNNFNNNLGNQMPSSNQQFMNQSFQQPVNAQPMYSNQMNIPPQMQNNNQNQKTSKKTLIIIIVAALALILTIAVIIVPFIIKEKEKVKYRPNMTVENLSIYVPATWEKEDGKTIKSPSGECELKCGKISDDIQKSQYLSSLENLGASFNKKSINGYDWDYAYMKEHSAEAFFYVSPSNFGEYAIMFIRDLNGVDEECQQYVKHLEESITLK